MICCWSKETTAFLLLVATLLGFIIPNSLGTTTRDFRKSATEKFNNGNTLSTFDGMEIETRVVNSATLMSFESTGDGIETPVQAWITENRQESTTETEESNERVEIPIESWNTESIHASGTKTKESDGEVETTVQAWITENRQESTTEIEESDNEVESTPIQDWIVANRPDDEVETPVQAWIVENRQNFTSETEESDDKMETPVQDWIASNKQESTANTGESDQVETPVQAWITENRQESTTESDESYGGGVMVNTFIENIQGDNHKNSFQLTNPIRSGNTIASSESESSEESERENSEDLERDDDFLSGGSEMRAIEKEEFEEKVTGEMISNLDEIVAVKELIQDDEKRGKILPFNSEKGMSGMSSYDDDFERENVTAKKSISLLLKIILGLFGLCFVVSLFMIYFKAKESMKYFQKMSDTRILSLKANNVNDNNV